MGVPVSPALFLPSWGDIQERGRGRIGSVCEKGSEYKCMDWVGVALRCQGKTDRGSGQRREMGATPSSVDRRVPMSMDRTVPMSMDTSKVDV